MPAPPSASPVDPTGADRAPLSILMVASEALPFVKTGGLADVTGALATALGRLGHEVTLVVPLYREVGWVGAPYARCHLSLGGHWYDVGFVERSLGARARVVLIECDQLYDRDGVYGSAGRDHPDNAVRFALLARAALELVMRARRPPDVIHAHDWQAGLVPVYARTLYGAHPLFARLATVFTIHNIAYQGLFGVETMSAVDLPARTFSMEGLEFWNQVSFLKGGVNFSDGVTTVSEGYAQEILTADYGYGFEGIMQSRRAAFRGILNGIDVEAWDPAHDRHIPAPFSARDLDGKHAAKRELLRRFRLPVNAADADTDAERPVIGLISRLVHQKGFDLVREALSELAELGATFVVLGSGDPEYEEMWRAAAERYPRTIAVQIGYDEALAHLVEAGADMFLMPSRYEPCGLNQMYSMRYGTVPIVRATGGLDDAVDDVDERTGAGTGFKFRDFDASAMLATLRKAIRVYGDNDRWRLIQQAGMRRDFSWTVSAARYVEAYADVLATVRGQS